MGFPRYEYWSGLPFPSPGDLSDPGVEPRSPRLQADSLPYEPHFIAGGETQPVGWGPGAGALALSSPETWLWMLWGQGKESRL